MEAMLRFILYMTDARHEKIRFNMRAFKKISFTYIYIYWELRTFNFNRAIDKLSFDILL